MQPIQMLNFESLKKLAFYKPSILRTFSDADSLVNKVHI